VGRGSAMTIASTSVESYEAKLVEKLRAGDSAAIEELYNLYKGRLHSLIFEQVGRDENVAEDLVQETFVAALSSLDRFRGDSQVYTWLRSIALHKINDFHRRQAREPRRESSSPEVDAVRLEQICDDGPATFSVLESEEICRSVHQALASLPQDYQKVLILKYLKDMPVLAISEAMGRSPKSVEGLLSRARKAMRASLTAKNYEG